MTKITGIIKQNKINAKLDFKVVKVGGEPYEGEYEVTPTRQTQILLSKDKVMKENVIVNPIPQNYGLITYNGSYLIVS